MRTTKPINDASDVLDHPIWHALTSAQAGLARASGGAWRFGSDVSPLSALRVPTREAFADLAKLVESGESAGLFTAAEVELPSDWEVVRARLIDQMVCESPIEAAGLVPLVLGAADVPEMLALTAATEPGPFLPNTIAMGRYFGLRSADGRLMAMAGERLKLTRFTEISAVCTDPAFRGQGLARRLMAHLAGLIFAEGKIPFLHVKTENGAKVLYEKLGFRTRREIQLTVIARK